MTQRGVQRRQARGQGRLRCVARARRGAQTGAGKWLFQAKRAITCQCRCGTMLAQRCQIDLGGRQLRSTCFTRATTSMQCGDGKSCLR